MAPHIFFIHISPMLLSQREFPMYARYLRGQFQETLALYEVKDQKPSLINFDYNDGLYTVPKELDGIAFATLLLPICGQQVWTLKRRRSFCAIRTRGSRSMCTHERSLRQSVRPTIA